MQCLNFEIFACSVSLRKYPRLVASLFKIGIKSLILHTFPSRHRRPEPVICINIQMFLADNTDNINLPISILSPWQR